MHPDGGTSEDTTRAAGDGGKAESLRANRRRRNPTKTAKKVAGIIKILLRFGINNNRFDTLPLNRRNVVHLAWNGKSSARASNPLAYSRNYARAQTNWIAGWTVLRSPTERPGLAARATDQQGERSERE